MVNVHPELAPKPLLPVAATFRRMNQLISHPNHAPLTPPSGRNPKRAAQRTRNHILPRTEIEIQSATIRCRASG
jgi:hypothetical protein